MAKSPNKHNRLYVTASPIDMKLADDIEKGKTGSKTEAKERAKTLVDEFGWDKTDAMKIWSFGPE
jgi:elongation factor 2